VSDPPFGWSSVWEWHRAVREYIEWGVAGE